MMLLKFKCITVLAFLIVECYVLSLNAQLNIERGERDVFDNPNCDSSTGVGCNCDDLKAACVNSTCKRCICPKTNGTFVPSNDTNDGQCVKNRHLLFIPASSKSFLVQQTECMKPVLHSNRVYYVKKAVCDAADLTQRWVWTRTNQLMNVALWKCLEQGPELYYKGSGFWYLIVETCRNKAKQLWSCQEQTFFLETPKLYMNSRKSSTNVLVTSDFNNRDLWTRYLSRENFCTKGSCNVKTTQGECCVFPFPYHGKTYYSCATVGVENTPWCTTNTTITKWGNCSEDLSSSFLFQSKKCMIPYNGYLGGRTCNVNNSNQHWIWTPNNQLMHVDTLKCLQQGKRSGKSQYWYLVLQECKNTETKQFWKCQGSTFFLKNDVTINLYIIDRAWVTTRKIKHALSRYSSGKYLCSKAFGCHEFVNPSSAVLLTDIKNCSQQCFQEREISVPYNIGESLCFVMWEKLEYLNNDQWKQLTFRDEIFIINKKNTRTFLQLNFRKFTNRWIGLIVKLYFYCAKKKMTKINLTDIKCVVVKFEGAGSYPAPIVLRTATKVPIFTTSATEKVSNSTSAPEQRKNNSSNVVIIIVVCVVIAILILCGILGFIFYKRKRRSEPKTTYDNAVVMAPDVHVEPVVAFRASSGSVSDDSGYEIPNIKKTVQSPGQAGQHKKRWNNRNVEDNVVIDDPGYVIPAVQNTESPGQAGALTAEPQHKKRWNNRNVEGNVVIDDPGYEIPNRPDAKTTSPDEAGALYAQPEGEKGDDGGYVKDNEMEDELGYLIPADEKKTNLGRDDDSSTLKGDAHDSAENGYYQSLKAEERYEHVYQGLLPNTNR